jgi:hypothetical protein
MTDRDHDEDLWQEFDRLPPAGPDRVQGLPGGQPQGFGFRTGVRSAKVASRVRRLRPGAWNGTGPHRRGCVHQPGPVAAARADGADRGRLRLAFSRLARQARNRRSTQ